MRSLSLAGFKTRLLPILFGLLFVIGWTYPATAFSTDSWDADINSLSLGQVEIDAKSLSEAWAKFGQQFGIRSILYYRYDNAISGPFHFDAHSITAVDFYRALCAQYPDFTYTIDSDTGIPWIIPSASRLHDLMATQVTFPVGPAWMPFYQEFLPALEIASDHAITYRQVSDLFQATFGFPTPRPASGTSARLVISSAMASQYTKSLLVYHGRTGTDQLETVNLCGQWPRDDITPSEVLLRQRLGITAERKSIAEIQQLQAASAHPSLQSDASQFIELRLYHIDFAHFLRSDNPHTQLSSCLAYGSVFVRSRIATSPQEAAALDAIPDDSLSAEERYEKYLELAMIQDDAAAYARLRVAASSLKVLPQDPWSTWRRETLPPEHLAPHQVDVQKKAEPISPPPKPTTNAAKRSPDARTVIAGAAVVIIMILLLVLRRKRFLIITMLSVINAQSGAEESVAPPIPDQTALWDHVKSVVPAPLGCNEVHDDYRLTNHGHASITIDSIRSGCGCTTGVATREVIDPGESAAIVVTLETAGRAGHQDKSVSVTYHNGTDVLNEKTQILHLITDIPSLAAIASWDREIVYWDLHEQATPKTCTLSFPTGHVLHIKSCGTHGEGFTSKAVFNESRHCIEVTMTPTDTVSQHVVDVVLRTDSNLESLQTMTLHGLVVKVQGNGP